MGRVVASCRRRGGIPGDAAFTLGLGPCKATRCGHPSRSGDAELAGSAAPVLRPGRPWRRGRYMTGAVRNQGDDGPDLVDRCRLVTSPWRVVFRREGAMAAISRLARRRIRLMCSVQAGRFLGTHQQSGSAAGPGLGRHAIGGERGALRRGGCRHAACSPVWVSVIPWCWAMTGCPPRQAGDETAGAAGAMSWRRPARPAAKVRRKYPCGVAPCMLKGWRQGNHFRPPG